MIYEILHYQNELMRDELNDYFISNEEMNFCGRERVMHLIKKMADVFMNQDSQLLTLLQAEIYLSENAEDASNKKIMREYKMFVDNKISVFSEILEDGKKDGSIRESVAANPTTALILWKNYYGFLQNLIILKKLKVYDEDYLNHVLDKYIEGLKLQLQN